MKRCGDSEGRSVSSAGRRGIYFADRAYECREPDAGAVRGGGLGDGGARGAGREAVEAGKATAGRWNCTVRDGRGGGDSARGVGSGGVSGVRACVVPFARTDQAGRRGAGVFDVDHDCDRHPDGDGVMFGASAGFERRTAEIRDAGGLSRNWGLSLQVAEVALTLILMIGGGLMIRTFVRPRRADGTGSEDVLTSAIRGRRGDLCEAGAEEGAAGHAHDSAGSSRLLSEAGPRCREDSGGNQRG